MRAYTLTLLLLLVFKILPAQNITIKWAEEQRDKKYELKSLVGINGKNIYVLRERKGTILDIVLETYDLNSMAVKSSKAVDLKIPDAKRTEYFGNEILDEHICIFTQYYDNKADKNSLLLNKLKLDGSAASPLMELSSVNSNRRGNAGGFAITYSPDSSLVMVHRNEVYSRKEAEKFSFKVVYKNMENIIWAKSVQLPYQDQDALLEQVKVDNSGNVYVLMRIEKDKKERTKKESHYYWKILSLKHPDGDIKEYDIDLGEDRIRDVTMEIDRKNRLVCTGLYSDRKNLGVTDGFFVIKVNSDNGKIISKTLSKVDGMYTTKKNSDKVKAYNRQPYYFRAIIPHDDGKSTVVAEQYLMYITTHTDSKGHTYTTYHYLYNDVMVFQLDANGKVEWATRIPKNQHTTNDNGFYSSIIVARNDNKVFIMWNDNPKNLEVYDDKELKNINRIKKTMATLAVVEQGGKYKKYQLFKNKELETYLRPKMYLRQGNNKVIIVAENRKEHRIGIVTLK